MILTWMEFSQSLCLILFFLSLKQSSCELELEVNLVCSYFIFPEGRRSSWTPAVTESREMLTYQHKHGKLYITNTLTVWMEQVQPLKSTLNVYRRELNAECSAS